MLLAIDAGNTNTVFALFDGKKSISVWRMTTNVHRTSDEYAAFLHSLMLERGIESNLVKEAIIASVVPDANSWLMRLCRDYFNCNPIVLGTLEVDPGIEILIDRPEELGSDRIVNAVAGCEKYPAPFVIIDFGTATTFDVIDEKKRYVGGAIAPGINLSLQALHLAAAKLPRVSVAQPQGIIGKNTVEAIQSGIFWGYVGLIEGMIARFQKEFSAHVTFIATGGLAPLFRDVIQNIQHFDSELTLNGLQIIHDRNSRNKKI